MQAHYNLVEVSERVLPLPNRTPGGMNRRTGLLRILRECRREPVPTHVGTTMRDERWETAVWLMISLSSAAALVLLLF